MSQLPIEGVSEIVSPSKVSFHCAGFRGVEIFSPHPEQHDLVALVQVLSRPRAHV